MFFPTTYHFTSKYDQIKIRFFTTYQDLTRNEKFVNQSFLKKILKMRPFLLFLKITFWRNPKILILISDGDQKDPKNCFLEIFSSNKN